MKHFRRTPEYDKLIRQYYPEDAENTPESVDVYEVVVISKQGGIPGSTWTYTYVDGKEVGIKLQFPDGTVCDKGIALRESPPEFNVQELP